MNSNVVLYALGTILLGAIGICFQDFALTWQPVPGIPARTLFANLSGLLLIVGGGAVLTPKGRRGGALLLAVFYGSWVVLLHGPIVLADPRAFYKWNGVAESLLLTIGGIALLAGSSAGTRGTLATVSRLAAGACALCFGSTHLVYAKETAAFVPAWIPPNQLFWAWATGLGYIAAGLALVSGIQARLAATLMAAMMASFVLLLHVPRVFGSPHSHVEWCMIAVASSLTGASLLVRKYAT
jgi:uncharacterized membrane protein YphA (DoxX/SURF4 family)